MVAAPEDGDTGPRVRVVGEPRAGAGVGRRHALRGRREPQHGLEDLGFTAVEALEDGSDVAGVDDVGDQRAPRRPDLAGSAP